MSAKLGKRQFLLSAALLLSLCGAQAQGAEKPLVPRSKIDYPTRTVERPITLSRGWIELSLGLSILGSDFYFDHDANKITGSYDYRVTTLSLQGRYGFSEI